MIKFKPNIPEQLRAKARKDWENEEIEFIGEFETYLAGYIAAIKRFGQQQCTRPHKEPWEGAADRMGGAFDQWEIDNAKAWR